jgi:flavin reductase (DIM6/NTAB) family NADH-FMN oxidoreductase RutF
MATDMSIKGRQAVGPDEFRLAMAEFASGVTVVTGLDGQEAVGFVCQSFASVSLAPPLVMFCAGHGSRSWPRIRSSGRFTVNVLGEDQADLCESFGSRRGRKFEETQWELSVWGTPSLAGVLMRVHADITQVVTAGDHDVVVGSVLGTERVMDSRPLIFFRGGFSLPDAVTPSAPPVRPRQSPPRTQPTISGSEV